MIDEHLLTNLQSACAFMHEIFIELQNVGFNEDQALILVANLVKSEDFKLQKPGGYADDK